MAFNIFEAEEQATIERLAQAPNKDPIAVAGLGLAGVALPPMIATHPLANLRKRPTANRCWRQFTFGLTFTALGRQLAGQTGGQEYVLLRPAMLGQVVDNA